MPIIFFIIFVLANAYYFFDYYVKKDLAFTNEDKFLLALFIVGLVGFTIFYLFLIFDRAKLIKIIDKIKKEIIDVEDNCILVNRDTQELILKYYKEE
jgi:hypothetical protein